MPTQERVHAGVVYCAPGEQHVIAVDLPAGATLREAVQVSGLLQRCPELAAAPLDLGVFNRPQPPHRWVRPGDRIEVYRPLTVDPKVARRVRADVKRQRGSG
ncbi:MAG: RnfH family protein [Burkholderiaceae bacterium]|nr:RnfH family protein [Burkholderiaceae bacterium]